MILFFLQQKKIYLLPVISCDEKKNVSLSSLSVCHRIQDVNTSVEGKVSMLFHILIEVRCVLLMECLLHSALTARMKWRK